MCLGLCHSLRAGAIEQVLNGRHGLRACNTCTQCTQAISGVASKEYSLEKVLEKMETDWKGVEFRCIEYKDT